ncbi:hypothetical protein [Hippea jasoniae]|uniref:hypothetical protein n=1 Tax=Hippea jasoniae TaxID=944479 RepID=UPI0005599AAF|nr:hypothetical protein [Hippea jasoniae]
MRKRLFFVFIFLLFSTNLFAASLYDVIKKQAWDDVKTQLHDQLNETLGSDLPVEDVLQSIDYFSHGEIEKGKRLIGETAAKEVFGLLVGSEAASIVGYAWEFAKYSFKSVNTWAHDQDRKAFVRTFLKPNVERWQSGYIPKWRDVVYQINSWFDDFEFNLARTDFFTDKKKWKEKLKNEMYAKTLEIYTKIKVYFYRKKQLEILAKQARWEILNSVEKRKQVLRKYARMLVLAKEKPTLENLRRYENNKRYRALVNNVAIINLSSKGNSQITIKEFIGMLKKISTFKLNDINHAAMQLMRAEVPLNAQNVRLYLLNKQFAEKIDRLAKKNLSKKPNKTQIKKIAEDMFNLSPYDVLELKLNRPATLMGEVLNFEKDRYNLTFNEKDVERFKSIYSKMGDNYLNGQLDFRRFISFKKRLFERIKLGGYERRYYNEMVSFAKDIDNQVAQKRLMAQKKLASKMEKICDLHGEAQSYIASKTSKLKENLKNHPVDFGLVKHLKSQTDQNGFFLHGLWKKLKWQDFDNVQNRLKVNIANASFDMQLLDSGYRDLNGFVERYYSTMQSYIDDYQFTQFSLMNFTCCYPFDEEKPAIIPYHDKRFFYKRCDLEQISKKYSGVVDYLTGLQNSFVKYSLVFDKNSDFLSFVEAQKKLNEAVWSMLSINFEKFKEQKDYTQIAENISNRFISLMSLGEFDAYAKRYMRYEHVESLLEKIKQNTQNSIGIHSISYFRQLIEKQNENLDACYDEAKRLSDKAKALSAYLKALNQTASDIKLWVGEVYEGYNRTASKAKEIYAHLANYKSQCDYIRDEYLKMELLSLKKMEKINEHLKQLLQKTASNQTSSYQTNRIIKLIGYLPFKPTFDVKNYSNSFAKPTSSHFHVAPPQVSDLTINSQIPHRRPYGYSYNFSKVNVGSVVVIAGNVKKLCDSSSCNIKEVFLENKQGRYECRMNGNRFSCPVKLKPYTIAFYLKAENANGDASKGIYITLAYYDIDKKIKNFLERFENYFNMHNSKTIFLTQEPVSGLLKSALSKRDIRLNFTSIKIVGFRNLSQGSNEYEVMVRVAFRRLPDKKHGVAVVHIVRKSFDFQYSISPFVITEIEGDNFFVASKTNASVSKTAKVAILSHVAHTNNGGYSIDFATGKFSNREMDLAAGFVNPKAEGYDKPYFNVGYIRDMGRISFMDLKACPKNGYTDYYATQRAYVGHVYCIKTLKGGYAKILVIDGGGSGAKAFIKFKWIYSANNKF